MAKRKPSTKRAAASGARQATDGERLQKVLAAAGLGSRRHCETLITEGRVEVDRRVVTELGTRVDPQQQKIRVDGVPLRQPRRVYYALNKPAGVVCTNRDQAGRTRVIDLVPDLERVYSIGRLDRASEGLILLTNDGDLANRVAHPRYGLLKTYEVRVAGHPTADELQTLRRGIHLAEGKAHFQSLRIRRRQGRSTDLLVTLDEGRNREIRRLLAHVGHKVMKLRRVAIGPLRLGGLASGEFRKLTREEIKQLESITRGRARAAGGDERAAPPRRAAASSPGPANSSPRRRKGKPGSAKSKPPPQRPARQPSGSVLEYDAGSGDAPPARRKRATQGKAGPKPKAKSKSSRRPKRKR